jgi:hypothetical protein
VQPNASGSVVNDAINKESVMSVVKNLLLAVGGAAIVATGLATSANAQVVAAGPGACEAYASEYAAVNAPQFGLFGWNAAYRHAYNECIAGGPDFASATPYGYRYGYRYGYAGPFAAVGSAVAAPVYFGANVAGAAVHAGTTVAGAALSLPGAILFGTASAFSPYATPEPTISPTAAPVVRKNYRGTYETPQY